MDHIVTYTNNYLGPLFLCTFTLIVTFASLFLFGLIYGLSTTFFIIGLFMLFITLYSYVMTAVINPGIPNRNYQRNLTECSNFLQEDFKLNYCEKCRIIREPTKAIHHCLECDICIEGFDHHCPWTGKCIGGRNSKYFYTFVAFLFIMLFYFMGVSIILTP